MHPGFWALGVAAAVIYAAMVIEAVHARHQDARDAVVPGGSMR